MLTMNEIQTWQGHEVHGPDGEKVGTLEHVYVDRETGEPTFASIKTGLFGMRSNLVPVDGLTGAGETINVQYDKATIKDAPNVDADEELTPEEEQRLYAYYQREYRAYEGRDVEAGDVDTGRATTGRDTSGPTTDDAMTRSEEELHVGTTERETGRARLRKYVVTDEVQQTVPVRREEVRVEGDTRR